ncbi:PREDICTED: butyrophilin subfamily 1 member A1-like, partial [Tinamus guttatus]|uniref:butyrophilin subfamily 1 member A1-like n=1 Tax=Tinamus guttatus TaxID=94827 RepID=UPI00052F0308
GVSLSGSQEPVVGVFGQDIILPCQLSPPVRLQNMVLLWRKFETENIIIRSYTDRENEELPGIGYKDRTELFPHEFIRGNLSLKLKSLRMKEAGQYQCFVQSAEGNHEAYVELQIQATAPVKISVMGPEGSGLGLSCKSMGWFPKPKVHWATQDGRSLEMKPVTTITQNEQQLYTLESRITVPAGKDVGEIRCTVQNTLTGMERNSAIELEGDVFPRTSPWLPAFWVLFVLVLLALAAAAFFVHQAKGKVDRRKADQEKALLDKDFRRARSYQVDIALDPSHKHPELIVSENGRCLQCSPSSQGSAPCVAVGHRGFASQRAYWEVEVGDGEGWELGVLSESTRAQVKQGELEEPPKEGIWAMGRVEGRYHPAEADTRLQGQEKAVVIGVFLEGELGKLVFYNVATMALIVEIPVPESQMLYPFLSLSPGSGGVGRDPLRICPLSDWDFPQILVQKRSRNDAKSKGKTGHPGGGSSQEVLANNSGPSSASQNPVASGSNDRGRQESCQTDPEPSPSPREHRQPSDEDKAGITAEIPEEGGSSHTSGHTETEKKAQT